MSKNTEQDDPGRVSRPQAGGMLWNAAIVLALVAIVLLFINNREMAGSLAQLDQHDREQIDQLRHDLAETTAAAEKSADSLARQSEETAAEAEARANQELRKAKADLSSAIAKQKREDEQKRQEVEGKLTDLQQANNDATAKLGEIGQNVDGVKGDVASTKSQLDQTGNDLKRVMGDMGVMGGLVATNATQLDALKALGERDYIQFDLKRGPRQKVGDMQLALAKTDPKHNRFTLDVLADDKLVEKRDRSINEPVQLYVAGSHQPDEIVVNEVKKDEVIGYVSVPKLKASR